MEKQGSVYFSIVRRTLLFFLALALVASAIPGIAGAENWKQEDARSMLTLINNFRTGNSAWYWNQDNTTWTELTDLGTLSYDYELEEVAKTRAAEQAQLVGHTRPNGSQWHTAFPGGYIVKGENIAIGYETAEAAFRGLQESSEGYAGQGHRRNMLSSDYTCVGIAGVEIDGEIYWVQEFGSKTAASEPQQSNNRTGWVQDGGSWRYFSGNGVMQTGWVKDGRSWYYLSGDGVMQTGWVQIDGKRYFLTSSGALQTGWVQDDGKWYYYSDNGEVKTGWMQSGANWYHFDKDGVMDTGWIKDGGTQYYFTDDGRMATGWVKNGNSWYYADSNGAIQTGWAKIGGQWYYFLSSGEMATGRVTIDGKEELFSKDGVWQGSEIAEIADYNTPLSDNKLIHLIRKVFNLLQEVLAD